MTPPGSFDYCAEKINGSVSEVPGGGVPPPYSYIKM